MSRVYFNFHSKEELEVFLIQRMVNNNNNNKRSHSNNNNNKIKLYINRISHHLLLVIKYYKLIKTQIILMTEINLLLQRQIL